jgi:hypothetical protein
VAQDLELSEGAVKQRLSRGRKLLQEQFLAFVAGALKQTNPGKTFTLGVIAALPLLATTAKAATATAAATKGGSAAKAATGAGMLGTFLTGGAMLLFSLFGVFGLFGRWVGRKMGRSSQQSALGRKRIIQFWRTLAIGFFLLVPPAFFVPRSLIHAHPGIFSVQSWSLAAFCWLVAAAWFIWLWQRWRDSRRQEDETPGTKPPTARSYNTWVILGMIGPACIVGRVTFSVFFSNDTWSCNRIPEVAAQKIISERQDARFTLFQYKRGAELEIRLLEDQRIGKVTPWNDSLHSALTEKGITYQTLIEYQDFHDGGAKAWLVMLSTLIVVAGIVLLLRRPGTQKFYQQEIATPRAERREKKIFAVCAALAMIAASLIFVLFAIKSSGQTISGAEAGRIVSGHKKAWFEVYQFDNGSKELWITLPNSGWHHPTFIAPADEPTLELLAENNISCKTYIQGRDFGYRGPGRWLSLFCSFILAAGAVILLWRGARKNRTIKTTD